MVDEGGVVPDLEQHRGVVEFILSLEVLLEVGQRRPRRGFVRPDRGQHLVGGGWQISETYRVKKSLFGLGRRSRPTTGPSSRIEDPLCYDFFTVYFVPLHHMENSHQPRHPKTQHSQGQNARRPCRAQSSRRHPSPPFQEVPCREPKTGYDPVFDFFGPLLFCRTDKISIPFRSFHTETQISRVERRGSVLRNGVGPRTAASIVSLWQYPSVSSRVGTRAEV